MTFRKETEYFRQALGISKETLFDLVEMHARDFLTVSQRLTRQEVASVMAREPFKIWWAQLWVNADKAMYHNLTIHDNIVIKDKDEEINRPLEEYYHIYHRFAVRLVQLPDFLTPKKKKIALKALEELKLENKDGIWKPLKGAVRHDTSAIAPGKTSNS